MTIVCTNVAHTSINSIDLHATASYRAWPGDHENGYGNVNDFSNPSVLPVSFSISPQWFRTWCRLYIEHSEYFYSREQTVRGDDFSDSPASLNQYPVSGAYGCQPQALPNVHQNKLLYIASFKGNRTGVPTYKRIPVSK